MYPSPSPLLETCDGRRLRWLTSSRLPSTPWLVLTPLHHHYYCRLPLLTPVVNTATTDGPGCPQVCTLPPGGCPPIMSEDCLLMNIYTPLGASAGDNLPVMIFIHGGQVRSRLSHMIAGGLKREFVTPVGVCLCWLVSVPCGLCGDPVVRRRKLCEQHECRHGCHPMYVHSCSYIYKKAFAPLCG